jgi:ADP-ribose pyrophosphatase
MKKIIPSDSILVPEQADLAFKGKIFDVYQWPEQLFDGTGHTFEMLKRPDTVVAVCVLDGKILVINDEQPHFGSRKGFPGGRVEQSDGSIETAARREIHEETGYSFKQWRLIQVRQPYTKIEWFVHVFLAWEEASHDEPHLDPGEKITLEQHTFAELKSLVLNKAEYLGDALSLFREFDNLEQLLALPAFSGQSVDR